MKKLLATASIISMLAIAPAFAQSSAPGMPSEPPAVTPSEKSVPAPSAVTPKATSDLPVSTSAASHRASNLLNASVKNGAGETIGDINDLLIDNTGKVTAVIIGVGGFLGIGERNVALQFEQVQFSSDANNRLNVMSNMSKESLKAAPEWRDPNAAAPTPTSK